jgi:SAM-dependent methyltransferase
LSAADHYPIVVEVLMKRANLAVLASLVVVLAAVALAQQPASAPSRQPDVVYVPTPPEVVDAMLSLAKVGPDDVVYDLGCGDGRIVIAAAQKYGARGIGIDIDPQRIREAEENAKAAGVTDRVTFRLGDLFQEDLKPATVVTLYLLTALNERLKPKLFAELKPGTRVVSHQFNMGDWQPEQTLELNGRHVFLWTIPTQSP